MKKYLAEMVGTMVLVLMGCGTAVSLGCTNADPETVVGTALAFGLANGQTEIVGNTKLIVKDIKINKNQLYKILTIGA